MGSRGRIYLAGSVLQAEGWLQPPCSPLSQASPGPTLRATNPYRRKHKVGCSWQPTSPPAVSATSTTVSGRPRKPGVRAFRQCLRSRGNASMAALGRPCASPSPSASASSRTRHPKVRKSLDPRDGICPRLKRFSLCRRSAAPRSRYPCQVRRESFARRRPAMPAGEAATVGTAGRREVPHRRRSRCYPVRKPGPLPPSGATVSSGAWISRRIHSQNAAVSGRGENCRGRVRWNASSALTQ